MSARTPAADLEELYVHTEEIWRKLDGARVLLTGVTGFVGTWLLDALAFARSAGDANINAVLGVRDKARFGRRFPHLVDAPWIEVVESDIRQIVLPRCELDFFIHAASTVDPQILTLDPAGTQSMVIAGTARVVEASAHCGARRGLIMSSGSIYGRDVEIARALNETEGSFADPFAANRVLAEAKRAAEAIAAAIAAKSGTEVIVARGFGMSGPWLPLSANFALGNFVRDALSGGPIVVQGDGSAIRSYLYGADVAAWLWTLLVNGKPATAYNVGSDVPISIRELADLVSLQTGAPVQQLTTNQQSSSDYFVPATDRARSLGLQSRVPIDEAIARMLAWHRSSSSL